MPTVALGAKFVQSRAGGQPATSTRAAWVAFYPGYPWGLPDVGLGLLFAVRCAVQVHLSHNVPGVPGTANDTGEMNPPKNDQTNSSSNNKRPRTAQLLDNAPEY